MSLNKIMTSQLMSRLPSKPARKLYERLGRNHTNASTDNSQYPPRKDKLKQVLRMANQKVGDEFLHGISFCFRKKCKR